MLDFSWIELLTIVIIGVLVLGPKDIPAMMYQIGKIVRRLQYMRFALSNQFDDFMQQAELRDPNKRYQQPAPIYEQEAEESPFADIEADIEKEPFHNVDDRFENDGDEDYYDPDMEEDEDYVEQELSFLRDLRADKKEGDE